MSLGELLQKDEPTSKQMVENDPHATVADLSETSRPPISQRAGARDELGGYGFLKPPRSEDELGRLAHYRVLRLIGQGGMGLVFEAEDEQLGRSVALKVIRPELAGTSEASLRFTREARIAAAIKHDHIVTVYQVGQHDSVAFLAMEYLQGLSLERWLERGRTPSIDLILRIGREVASGLAAAHSLDLVHRDIKPANIWLETPHGRAKILDFGHARAVRDEDVLITRAGAIMGTPAFMSPEQARGDSVDASCDLFSLGCVLYRLCTGRLPFQGTTIIAVLTALVSDSVPPPPRELNPAVPLELDALVVQLLSKNSADRPTSAQAVVDAIRRIERQSSAERRAAELTPSLPKFVEVAQPKVSQRFGLLPIIATLAVVAIGLVWFAMLFLLPSSNPRERMPVGPAEVVASVEPIKMPTADVAKPESVQLPPELVGPPMSADSPVIREVIKVIPPPVTPAPDVVPLPPPPAVSQSATTGDWGVVFDPDGDCKVALNLEAHRAEIDVPGKPHVLSAELGRVNAPRILRKIQGDFEARVRVTGIDQPSARTTMVQYAPYHGAGLLLWQNDENYLRLEIAAQSRKGKPFHYANFEYRQNGQLAYSKRIDFEDQTSYLRIQRQGNEVRASISQDNVRWRSFSPLEVEFKSGLQVGVAAINTATKPLMAVLEDFRVIATPSDIKVLP